MAVIRLGRVQYAIMEVLWRKRRATAREITEELDETPPLAHSTVQTLLRKLEAKKVVAHEALERTFYFRALVEPEEVRAPATREFIARLFDGSASSLISYLLKNERIPKKELEQIHSLIEQAKKKGGD